MTNNINTCTCTRPFSIDFGKIQLFLQLGIFSHIILSCESFGKELLKENSNVIFLAVIDATFHLIVNILFSGAMISALQKYDWEKSF